MPLVGRSTPDSRFTNVVLPAPLGPISAWRAPGGRLKVTLSVAVMPPNVFISERVSTTGDVMAGLPHLYRPCG